MVGDCNTDEALASAKWIYSNAQDTANYSYRRDLELATGDCILHEIFPEPGRFDKLTVHLRAYLKHEETITNFEKDLWAAYGYPSAPKSRDLETETLRKLEEAEGDERKKIEKIWEVVEWIERSSEEARNFSLLGYSAPWERLHPDSPGPFLSLGTHFWALVIGNDDYPGAPLGGCINDAHLVSDYLMEYLHVPKDHIVLLENACRNEMVDALYNLRDNEKIPFGDNILIHYSGYASGTQIQGSWSPLAWTICPVDRKCRGSGDISERELNGILSELSIAKGPKITLITDCGYKGISVRSGPSVRKSIGSVFRNAPPVETDALKLGMDNPRRRSEVDICSANWERDLTSFVQLSPGVSTLEVDAGVGKGRHGLFTLAVIKALESKECRGATYEGVIQIICPLRQYQYPEVFGTRRASLLWFRDTAHLEGQEESNSSSVPSACLIM